VDTDFLQTAQTAQIPPMLGADRDQQEEYTSLRIRFVCNTIRDVSSLFVAQGAAC
jgi:hypothetical protein